MAITSVEQRMGTNTSRVLYSQSILPDDDSLVSNIRLHLEGFLARVPHAALEKLLRVSLQKLSKLSPSSALHKNKGKMWILDSTLADANFSSLHTIFINR
jgi:hypothetical protein